MKHSKTKEIELVELIDMFTNDVEKKQKVHVRMLEKAGELQYEISCLETTLHHLKGELRAID